MTEAASERPADRAGATGPPPDTRHTADGLRARVTVGQQALMTLHELHPESAAYNSADALRLRGRLDVDALEEALNRLVARHAALRTAFRREAGQPFQQIAGRLRVAIERVGFDAAAATMTDDEFDRQLRVRAAAPFDIAQAPLLRACCFRRAEDDFVLLVTQHHLVTDGGSLDVFWHELGEHYRAIHERRDWAGPDVPQAHDFAGWEVSWLHGREAAEQLARWRQRLHDLEPLRLPGPGASRGDGPDEGSVVEFDWAPELVAGVRRTAIGLRATPFLVMLAAFELLLSRQSGQLRFGVGTVAAARPGEYDRSIGFFANMIVLRASLIGSPSFAELVGRVRSDTFDALALQQVPFARLAANAPQAAARRPGEQSLFGAAFFFQKAPVAPDTFGDLDASFRHVPPASVMFDLSLTVRETPDGWRGAFHYRSDRFEDAWIRSLARQFPRLLASALAQPRVATERLSMYSDDEAQRLAHGLCGPHRPAPAPATVLQLFEAQAKRSPDAIAVCCNGRRMTYRTLNASANRLARRLRSRGVRTESIVGVHLERGLELVVALLAIWKAGGAYLPLEIHSPASRNERRLAIAQPALVLGAARDLAALPGELRDRMLAIDTPEFLLATESDDANDPEPQAGPGHLAYVLFTSGSTGDPKAVMIEHRSLLAHCDWFADAFGLHPEDRGLQRATLGFDTAGVEIWPILVSGARLVIADERQASDPVALADLIRSEGVTIAQFVPVMLGAYCDVLEARRGAPPLRAACVGGEALPARLAERWLETTGIALFNLYGPTECTIDATWHRCTSRSTGATVPIGRPIANTRVHLVDAQLRPVPPGAEGEICIAGPGLARGYLNPPSPDRDPFVLLDTGQGSPTRVYRSGDRARLDADGNLVFLGRIDDQVKVRGHRVEPGEIEAALIAAGARQAAVLARPDPLGSNRLTAFVVPPSGPQRPWSELLRDRLPEALVPSAVIERSSLPLLPSGKVDRAALSEQQLPSEAPADRPVPLRTPTEQRLARLWHDVLGTSVRSADDDFFAAGGHSLSAAVLASRIASHFGAPVRLVDVLRSPRLSAIAGTVDRLLAEPPTGQPSNATSPGEPTGPRNSDGGDDTTGVAHRSTPPRTFTISLRRGGG